VRLGIERKSRNKLSRTNTPVAKGCIFIERLDQYAVIPQFHLLDRQAPLEILFPDGVA
jgi:hypothetical protein